MKSGVGLWLAIAGMLGGAGPAFAHHSTAMFDYSKNQTLVGVVRAFQWSNPHSFIQLVVDDGHSQPQEWSIEAGAPAMMSLTGWSRDSLKRGDKVTVTFAPLRSGEHGGTLRTVTLPSGKVLHGAAENIKADPSGKPTSIPLPDLQHTEPK